MGTRFELAAHGTSEPTFRAAAEEAFEEVRRLEDLFSLYREGSDVGRLNRAAGSPDWVRIHPLTAELLTVSRSLSETTGGAFDPTAGALVRAWGFHGADGARPDPGVLDACRGRVGWDLLEGDSSAPAVRWKREGCLLDLGAVAKGFALDRAAGLLEESGLEDFLLHGGTSGVVARGVGLDGTPWKVALPVAAGGDGSDADRVAPLHNESLSYSAAWGRSFVEDGRRRGHILDPRDGLPVRGRIAAAVAGPSAAVTDALSTALMVSGETLGRELPTKFPGYRVLVLVDAGPGDR